jgi:hypothetical protein
MISDPYIKRLRADADWAIRSKPLLHTLDSRFPAAQWYAELPLANFDISWPAPDDWNRFRLGIQFERLWQTAIAHMTGYRLLASNLPVRGQGRTLGEFDLIVDCNDRTEHWELAVKFYLGRGELAHPGNWFGPNPEDNLGGKLNRLLDHQLQLANLPEAATLLDSMNIKPVTQAACLVKGRLFYPWQDFVDGKKLFPTCVNEEHLSGWWITLADFTRLFSNTRTRWVYLEKALWLSPIANSDNLPLLDSAQALDLFRTSLGTQVVHVAMVDSQGQEISRGFVVSQDWLHRTRL